MSCRSVDAITPSQETVINVIVTVPVVITITIRLPLQYGIYRIIVAVSLFQSHFQLHTFKGTVQSFE